MTPAPDAQDKPFRVDEATIDELHTAIKHAFDPQNLLNPGKA